MAHKSGFYLCNWNKVLQSNYEILQRNSSSSVLIPGNWRPISILHLHIDSVILPENAPRHEGARAHEQNDMEQKHLRVDRGQDAHERSYRVFLHRVHL